MTSDDYQKLQDLQSVAGNIVKESYELGLKYRFDNPQSSDELYEQRKVEELEEKEQEYGRNNLSKTS